MTGTPNSSTPGLISWHAPHSRLAVVLNGSQRAASGQVSNPGVQWLLVPVKTYLLGAHASVNELLYGCPLSRGREPYDVPIQRARSHFSAAATNEDPPRSQRSGGVIIPGDAILLDQLIVCYLTWLFDGVREEPTLRRSTCADAGTFSGLGVASH